MMDSLPAGSSVLLAMLWAVLLIVAVVVVWDRSNAGVIGKAIWVAVAVLVPIVGAIAAMGFVWWSVLEHPGETDA